MIVKECNFNAYVQTKNFPTGNFSTVLSENRKKHHSITESVLLHEPTFWRTLWTRFLETIRFGMVNFLTQPLRIESETDFLASFLKFQSQPNKSVHFFFTPAQLFKKFSFGNEGTVIKMTRNLEENNYFPLRMNEKSEELLVFQKLRKLGLNSSFAFFFNS